MSTKALLNRISKRIIYTKISPYIVAQNNKGKSKALIVEKTPDIKWNYDALIIPEIEDTKIFYNIASLLRKDGYNIENSIKDNNLSPPLYSIIVNFKRDKKDC